MKKILYIHHGSSRGGAPRSLGFLIANLDKREYNPFLVYRSNDELLPAMFEELGVPTLYVSGIHPFHGSTVSGMDFKQGISNLVYALPTYHSTLSLLREIKPDIVHLNSTCLFMCAMACKTFSNEIKVVCHVREPLLTGLFGKTIKHMSYKYVDRFIAIDKYDARSVDPNLKKTDIVYNFVDLDKYNTNVSSNVIRDELEIRKESTVFLNLARVSPENGSLEIVDAWRKAFPDNYDMQLVLVGEDPVNEREYAAKVHNKAKGANNIHILPFRKDVVEVIASSDVIICSFIKPHFSRAIIEGAAMGKPSISNNIEGPNELIIDNETGFYFEVFDSESLKQTSLKIRDYETRAKMGKAARRFAEQNFSDKNNSEKTFDVYKRLFSS